MPRTWIDLRHLRTGPMGLALLGGLALLETGCSSDDGSYGGGYDYDDGGYDEGGGDGAVSAGESGQGTSGGDTGGADDGEATSGETGEATGTTGEAACDDQEPVTLYLSPDDSNSMSSPVQVREAVLEGWSSLSAVPLRVWEFFNYYDFDYPAAEPGTVTVTPSLYRDPEGAEGEYILQIGIASEIVSPEDRAPMNVTFVLDTSGSMSGHPIEMLRETCRAVAASLREGDIVSMVTWDTQNTVLLAAHTVTSSDDPVLLEAIEAIDAGGGTNLEAGLAAGYGLATDAYTPDRINRVLLVSDGGANVGITDVELIAQHAGGNDEDGIYMVGVGVGDASTYHDDLMNEVTDVGKGASVFVASSEEAWKLFNERFVSTMDVAMRDVQVRLELPPGFEIVKFSGEEYSADPSEIEPQHLAPSDVMVFHQRIKTCAPELVTDETEITVTAHFKDAVTFAPGEVSTSITFGSLLESQSPALLKGAAIAAYVDALTAVKESAPNDARNTTMTLALAALTSAEAMLPADPDLAEIRSVLEAL